MFYRVVVLLFFGLLVIPLVASPPPAAPQGPSAYEHSLPTPNELPVVAEHHYRLSGSARPFLFWITRDNVGSGRMTWRRSANGTLAFELLMGSDPERAPFKANRWGYIREVVQGDSAELVAVKSDTEEETIAEAKASVNQPSRDRGLTFIREHVSPHETRAASAIVDVGRAATYRDLDFVLDRMSSIHEWEERVRDILVNLGLQEIVSYRMTSPERESRLVAHNEYVVIANPITPERRVMRRSLLASVLEAAEANSRAESIAMFEIGPIFEPNKDGLPDEPSKLALVMSGSRMATAWDVKDSPAFDFYDM